MKKHIGYSLIELILFIVVTGILATTILLALVNIGLKTPIDRQQIIALENAQQCMEWYLGQRRLNGFSGITCSASPSTPTICALPSGYSFSNSITCTTLSSDTNYKLITVTVSGSGDASLTSLIADY
jgi:VCBS repeat-containing protein